MAYKLHIAALIATTSSLLIRYLIKRRYEAACKALADSRYSRDCYYHFIYVTCQNMDCRLHVDKRVACGDTCSFTYLMRLCTFINSARSSVCLCMYTASLDTVCEALIKAHKRGVNVRIITDFEMTRTNRNVFQGTKNTGIKVKCQQNTVGTMMHHKFCLVDEDDSKSAKLFFGSLNLTMQGICNNWETVVFTNNKAMIARFRDEFNYLWAEFTVLS